MTTAACEASKSRKVSFSAIEAEDAGKAAEDAGKAVLDVIDKLATQAREAEAHAARLARLGTAVPISAERGRTMRRKSKDLQDQMMQLLDGKLERAFKQFDLDGNGTLDKAELKEAFEAAGRAPSDEQLNRSIKMLDKNGDGVIDMDEFKAIALQCSMQVS